MPSLFLTGATGYIGGDALYSITTTYPDLSVTALVRNSDKGALVAAQYARVRLVYGALDDTNLLTTEAAAADMVVHCADCDHEEAANALIAGLSSRDTPGFLIHTSGTGILGWADIETRLWGVERGKIYNDTDGISEVTSLPDSAPHRPVDKIVLAAGQDGTVRTAIVCPPCIYGPGRGPGNKRSVQAPVYASTTLKRGKGFVVQGGGNVWNEVHVQDLSDLYTRLVGAALEGGGNATWGPEGYYFAENGAVAWGEAGREIARVAAKMKLIESAEVDRLSEEEAEKVLVLPLFLWGSNSRCEARRAREVLGWVPKEKRMLELLPQLLEEEAKTLGLVVGHAAKAAGGV